MTLDEKSTQRVTHPVDGEGMKRGLLLETLAATTPVFLALSGLNCGLAGPMPTAGVNADDGSASVAPSPAPDTEDGNPGPRVGPFVPYDGGPPALGQVGPDGGTLSRVLFAVVGDTRPATVDDTSGYPADVVTSVFGGINALAARPPMVVSTGDYVFASASSTAANSQASPQFDIYMQARARFAGAFFPAMGNHECTGATSSNCGAGAANGEPANYAAFVAKMLAPIHETLPYYAIDVGANDGTWSVKFVFVAANAWSSAQDAWFESVMARPTTYTFVVRHEPATANTAPGVAPSQAIMERHPYTLAIVGHSHTYRHDAVNPREVVLGNGGAPLSSKDYGFGVFSQRADGAIAVDMLDWQTGRADAAFHFAVQADGTTAP